MAVRWPHPYQQREHAGLHEGRQADINLVDAGGNLTAQPLSHNDAATEAVVTAVSLWIAVAGACTAACALLRVRLNRARYAAWDRHLDDRADNDGQTNRAA